jgi:hypothetical protein
MAKAFEAVPTPSYEEFQARVTPDYKDWIVSQEVDAFAQIVSATRPGWKRNLPREIVDNLTGREAIEQLSGQLLINCFRSRLEYVLGLAAWHTFTGLAFIEGEELSRLSEADGVMPSADS